MTNCFSRVHRGLVMEEFRNNPEQNENMFFIDSMENFDVDVFGRLICAFMNSLSGGNIWLGLDKDGRCQGIEMNRKFRDTIRRAFARLTFESGYMM